MSKVGLVLFVKNEADDLPWWISWHLSIGFDTIIVYDDYSSDGTWEILQSISTEFDIRPRRAVQSLRFNHRQALTYMSALDELRDEFDWLMYLDADEYLDILNGEPVKTYLSRYDESIDGIAIHWKCFGSNRHVEKPATPNVFDNYVTHGEHDFELNQCVKSFFRPGHAVSRYINPHRFDVSGRYITADGADIEWQEKHDERPVAPPVWSKAIIRHFIIRSAEHFVEKSKRRSDIRSARIGIGLFNAYDRNELCDEMPRRRVDAMLPILYRIQQKVSQQFLLQNENSISDVAIHRHKEAALVSVSSPHTHFGSIIVAEMQSGRLFHAHPGYDENLFAPVTVFQTSRFPDKIFMTVLSRFLPLFIKDEPRVSTVLSFERIQIQGNTFALKSPLTAKIVSFVEQSDASAGYVECNRDWTDAWETLTSTGQAFDSEDPLLVLIVRALDRFDSQKTPEDGLDLPRAIDATVAGMVVDPRSENETRMIYDHINAIPWLKKDRALSL